ncbi:MAG: 30S ribosomal protein S1 [Planctomycetia bacterium]|nr:30S ribosomal protein S1 [Planctomycetia bacterium]
MVNRTLLRGLDSLDDKVDDIVLDDDAIIEYLGEEKEIALNSILEGRVVRIDGEYVIVDVGYKSEGGIPLTEWDENEAKPQPGDVVKVLVEELEDTMTADDMASRGMIVLSKRKAARIENWHRFVEKVKEGDLVEGVVTKKIKGGLLVDVDGVHVFLPASQVDVRRPTDVNDFIDKPLKCKILSIDLDRHNVVVSRRALIEEERKQKKEALLATLEVGQLREGVVKNIAEFGAFIDLGGIDGLLHITDMSWGRVTDPRQIVSIDEKIEVVILSIDREKEKISLSLREKTPSPWEHVEEKYPKGSRVKGVVVNIMPYGAFVKLEEGVEGLVHISQMSWTRRVTHPNEMLSVGQEVEVVVIEVKKAEKEISLGLKQTTEDPWEKVDEKYPVGSRVKGVVRNLTNYGAFVELEEGVDGLLHISDMSWVRKITHPNEIVKKGEEIECVVTQIDKRGHRIALGLKQLTEDPWISEIPNKFRPGQIVRGKVTKITNFGVFVGLDEYLEGLLHISELSTDKIENAEDVVKPDEELEVMVLRVDVENRKIGLSLKRTGEVEQVAEEKEEAPALANTAHANRQLKGGAGEGSGPLFDVNILNDVKDAE